MRTPILLLLTAVAAIGWTTRTPAADRKRIDEAIKKGGDFLRTAYDPKGNNRGTYGIGGMVLSGIAMLEAGVKPDDPSVKYVANNTRASALGQTETYQMSLCILFLDRLGDPGDVPLIQMLGVRLYAGLNANGGWSYHCWQDSNQGDSAQLLAVLQKGGPTGRANPKEQDKKDDGFLKPAETEKVTHKLHPEVARTLAAVHQTIRTNGRGGVGGYSNDDNSNTQFGIIGLWVAARNGVPAKDAFALIEARFIRSQNADGGWAYNTSVANFSGSTVAMTCAGLIGLAVGGAAKETQRLTGEKVDRKDAPEDDPFFNPKKGDGEKAEPAVKVKPVGGAQRDRSAEAGLKALGGFLNAQLQKNAGGRNQQAGGPNGALGNFVGLGNGLYTMWSLERVAVAYSLDTIGGVDWYDWGSDLILSMQTANGSFNDSSYESDINTSFAILFLAKANFTKDLSSKNKGKDPGKVELRGGGAQSPLMAPPPKDRDAAHRGATGPMGTVPNDELLPRGGFSLPKVVQPTEAGEAENVSKGLTGATTETDWTAKLAEARDTKGAKWTRGLTLAAARLDGDKRRQARDALAERLTRMTARTLREMLRDPEAELRRAACLACAMKDARAHIPDLIERITDPSDLVVRAARAGLASFAGTDFGPKNAGDDEGKVKAAADWAKWYDSQNQKK